MILQCFLFTAMPKTNVQEEEDESSMSTAYEPPSVRNKKVAKYLSEDNPQPAFSRQSGMSQSLLWCYLPTLQLHETGDT